jgi:hypothetical protein
MTSLVNRTYPSRHENELDPRRQRGSWLGIVLLLLAGLLVFAHGCHGDEDNELFGEYLVTTK